MLNQNFSRSLIELLPREIIRAILANSEDPEELSQVEILSYLPPRMREEIARSLPEDRLRAIPHEWGWLARRKQKPPLGDWRTWLVLAGRGFGKTRTGAEWVRGPTNQSDCVGRSMRRLGVKLASWRYPDAWDMLMFGLRLGDDPRVVVTTTPKPTKIIRELIADPTTRLTRGSSYENRRNLAKAFFTQIVRKYEGTRIGRQELNAEVLDDVPGALWTRALLEELRWPAGKRVPDLSRVVVAVDPAVTSGEEADETGLIVAGRDYEGRGYVLDDRSGRYAPIEWAREAVMLYRKYDADRVVAEVNNGGDMVEATLRMVDENVSFNAVRASRGKIVRAEPVAALYEQKRAHHIGFFPVLEDQMTSFTSDLDRQSAGYSPDRVDALVWAFTELLVAPMPSYAAYEIARERAEAVIAQRRAEEEARRPKLTPAKGSVEYMELLKSLNKPR